MQNVEIAFAIPIRVKPDRNFAHVTIRPHAVFLSDPVGDACDLSRTALNERILP